LRFGDGDRFLELVETIRTRAPHAGLRSNVIVGFPGETERDLEELERFLAAARLDVVGVFGYSDEDGTSAADLPDHLPQHVVDERVDRVGRLVEELTSQRAADRIGETVQVLVEEIDEDGVTGGAEHQGPDVDGLCVLAVADSRSSDTGWFGAGSLPSPRIGDLVTGVVIDSEGVDLVVAPQ